MVPIVLTIAGSDSCGGAGIQADIKAISANGAYAASVITAVTAQNTKEVKAVEILQARVVEDQLEAVLSDLDVAVIKVGMLFSRELIKSVSTFLSKTDIPIVLDPVMVSKSGASLLENDAISALKEELVPQALLLTPNVPEAASLLDVKPAVSECDIIAQGKSLCKLGCKAVLMKGGHQKGENCIDRLIFSDEREMSVFSAVRKSTVNTHGTGCTLSSAIASNLSKGINLEESVEKAHLWLQGAIENADQLRVGRGAGPVHHFYRGLK